VVTGYLFAVGLTSVNMVADKIVNIDMTLINLER